MGWDDSPEMPEGHRVEGTDPGGAAPAEGGRPRTRIPRAFWIAMAIADIAIIAVVILIVTRA